MAVGQGPVFLGWVEEQAQDIEVEAIFLIAGPFIRADENTAFKLWVSQHHYLTQKRGKLVEGRKQESKSSKECSTMAKEKNSKRKSKDHE